MHNPNNMVVIYMQKLHNTGMYHVLPRGQVTNHKRVTNESLSKRSLTRSNVVL